MGANDEWNIYQFFQIFNVLDYNIDSNEADHIYDLQNPLSRNKSKNSTNKMEENKEDEESDIESKDFSFNKGYSNSKEHSLKELEENKIGVNIYDIIVGRDYELKFSKTMNYFWNSVFYLLGKLILIKSKQSFRYLLQFIRHLFTYLFLSYFYINWNNNQ